MEKKNWGKWEYEFDKAYPREYESICGGHEKCDLMNVRYVLGEEFTESDRNGDKALICIGLNPSTAVPMNLDLTVSRVRKYALGKYRAWYMLNLYPQRATDSDDLDKEKDFDTTINKSNINAIAKLLNTLGKENCHIWLAWGTSITKRDYLESVCTEEIGKLLNGYTLYAYTRNVATIGTEFYPGHPLVMPKDMKLIPIELTTRGHVKILKNK